MLGVELHLYMQGGRYNTHSMDLGLTENYSGGEGGEGVHHNKVYVTSFPSILIGREICPSRTTILPLNPTRGVLYLDKFSAFNPNPLYRSRYITMTLLP